MSETTSFEVDQFFECPKCGAQVAGGPSYVKFTPPACSLFHERTEMKQIMAPRFGVRASGGDDDA